MPVLSQGILAGQRAQPSPQSPLWEVTNPAWAATIIPSSDPNFASLFPGVQDFCWETWVNPDTWINQPAPIVTWGQPVVTASNLGLSISPNIDGSNTIAFDAYIMGVASTRVATLASSYWNTWIHLAFCRIGSTVNVYANGILVGQSTGVTANLDQSTVGSDQWWTYCGPVGDRDQSNSYPVGCNWRNMRWTVGNNVYGNVSSFTPPPLTEDIQPVTGTQFIIWPDATTNVTTYPFSADYYTINYQFTPNNGAATNAFPGTALYSYPNNLLMLPLDSVAGVAGTWTNNGTSPNQPKYTTAGPSPVYGNSCGDFTAVGTDVRISSSNTSMVDWSNAGLMYLWFYVPADITNEKKTIVAVENTNGFVLNIGRTGQGLDWVSVSAFGGAELAYGQHIWARNAWNFLCVQKYYLGSPGAISAWAGAQGDNYATNLNLVDNGGSTFTFANSGNVSIGCTAGSTVSSQMYFNQLLCFTSSFNGTSSASIFDPNLSSIPILDIPTESYPSLVTGFDFQGTNGNTNIQPSNP